MTAAQVIEQLKALTPEERAKVIDFIEEEKARQHVKDADKKTFDAAATWVFDEHAELMRKLSK